MSNRFFYRKLIIILSVICGAFLIAGTVFMNFSVSETLAYGSDGIIQDSSWNETLFVNHDMSKPENLEKNDVTAGDQNTNGVNGAGLTFVDNINIVHNNHFRGTTSVSENHVVVYELKNSFDASDYGYVEMNYYSEGVTFDLSFFSCNQKNLIKENSILNKTVIGQTKIVLDSSLLADSNGKVNSITVLVNSASPQAGSLYLDGIKLKSNSLRMLGGSVRLCEPTGLGFSISIDKNYYDNLENMYGKNNVSTGVLITKSDLSDGVTPLSFASEDFVNVVNNGWIDSSDSLNYIYRGSIVKIPENHFATDFIGRGYIKVMVDGKSDYIYTDQCVRNISEVASKAYHDKSIEWTEGEKSVLKRYSGGAFIENGMTEYKIVLPSAPKKTEITSANILNEKICQSTGCASIPVVHENSQTVEKGIYIGNTEKKQTKLQLPTDDEAHLIATDNNGNIFIKGHSSSISEYDFVYDRGTIYGVYDFLEKYFGYRFLNVDNNTDEIIETYDNVSQINIVDIKSEIIVPKIALRAYSAYNIDFEKTIQPYASMLRHNTNLAKMGAGQDNNAAKYGYAHHLEYYAPPFHNSFDTLTAGVKLYNNLYPGSNLTTDDFSYVLPEMNGKREVCMTKSVVVNDRTVTSKDIITLALKDKIASSYTWTAPNHYYVYGQEDSHKNEECSCAQCKNERTLYGGASGQLINFCNGIIEDIESDAEFMAKYPDFKIITFAYMYTAEAPSTNIKCNDKLIMRIALHDGNEFFGLNSAHNEVTKNRVNNWKSHTGKEVMYWIYDSDFQSYAGYYPTINRSIADNVKMVIDNGGKYLMVNSSGAKNDWDSEMRLYIYSKLMYGFDDEKYSRDPEMYVREIAEEYVRGYFGQNNVLGVMDIIDSYQNMYLSKGGITPLKVNGKIDKSSLRSELKTIETKINNLIAGETNTTYKNRLKLIQISVLADLYDAGENGYSAKTKLRNLCNECGFTEWSEGLTVEQKLG